MYGRSGFKSFMWVDYQLVAKVKPTEEVTKLAETVACENIQKLTSAEVVNDFDNSISPFKRSEVIFNVSNSSSSPNKMLMIMAGAV